MSAKETTQAISPLIAPYIKRPAEAFPKVAFNTDAMERLERVVATLTPDEAAVVRLAVATRLDVPEIAKRLEMERRVAVVALNTGFNKLGYKVRDPLRTAIETGLLGSADSNGSLKPQPAAVDMDAVKAYTKFMIEMRRAGKSLTMDSFVTHFGHKPVEVLGHLNNVRSHFKIQVERSFDMQADQVMMRVQAISAQRRLVKGDLKILEA